MPINAFPINTVPPTAGLIANVPSGSVTAVDVQTAINQLASLIPSPGSGTDPLFLTQGFAVNVYNPSALSGAGYSRGVLIDFRTDSSTIAPQFSNAVGIDLEYRAINGMAVLNGTTGPAKISFMPLQTKAYIQGSGQKFVHTNWMEAFGMSDTAIYGNQFVQFAGGPVNGDEGQGWGLVSNLQQQTFLVRTTISSKPPQSTVNTTTAQAISKSEVAQTVNVTSGAGAVVGDWVIVEQEVQNGGPNLEAVQIEACTTTTPGTIRGKFTRTHNIGVTVTPALRLFCTSTFQMGQDRILVNMSQPSHGTANAFGQVTTISGGGMDFSAPAALSNNMVGGGATNIGAISLAVDDYSSAPFGGANGPLRDWYAITAVTTPTHLAIHSLSIANDQSYKGRGINPALLPSAYTIRPAARVLRIIGDAGAIVTGEIICETSTATWSAGDSVEQAICPYADVTGWNYSMSAYTAGGTYRAFQAIKNTGVRTFAYCFFLDDWGDIHQAGGDDISWGTVFGVNTTHNIGIDLRGTRQTAIKLYDATSGGQVDAGSFIRWGTASLGIHSGNGGLIVKPSNGWDGITSINSGVPTSMLQFYDIGRGSNPSNLCMQMAWGGPLYLPVCQNRTQQIWLEDDDGGGAGNANFSRWFVRWVSHVLEIGTEQGGTGTAQPLVLKTNNVEQLRLAPRAAIKFSAAPSFSANGSVATSITSVGPTGAATTVQKWLTIIDNTGATRYIPCF